MLLLLLTSLIIHIEPSVPYFLQIFELLLEPQPLKDPRCAYGIREVLLQLLCQPCL